MNKFDAVANLAAFLMEQKGSVLARWEGRLTAKQQREMFGAFLGKGWIIIDGETETIAHLVKVCFGLDYNTTFAESWSAINEAVTRKNLPCNAHNSNIPRF